MLTLSCDKIQPLLHSVHSPSPITVIKYLSFFICYSLAAQFFSTFGIPHNERQPRMVWEIQINKIRISTTHSNTKNFGYNVEHFTFSEPCTVIHICEQYQQDAHFFLKFTSTKLSSTCFEQIIVHHREVCTSSLEHFTLHLMRSLVADTKNLYQSIVSATRLLIRCTGKYCNLLVQTSWWWTNICSKHAEDNLIEVNY